MFIQEFYSNMHAIDTSIPRFTTVFYGTRIVVTPDFISEVLQVPRMDLPNYLKSFSKIFSLFLLKINNTAILFLVLFSSKKKKKKKKRKR